MPTDPGCYEERCRLTDRVALSPAPGPWPPVPCPRRLSPSGAGDCPRGRRSPRPARRDRACQPQDRVSRRPRRHHARRRPVQSAVPLLRRVRPLGRCRPDHPLPAAGATVGRQGRPVHRNPAPPGSPGPLPARRAGPRLPGTRRSGRGLYRRINTWRLDRQRLAAVTAAAAPGIPIIDTSTGPDPGVDGRPTESSHEISVAGGGNNLPASFSGNRCPRPGLFMLRAARPPRGGKQGEERARIRARAHRRPAAARPAGCVAGGTDGRGLR
jgi:hypothetical protein